MTMIVTEIENPKEELLVNGEPAENMEPKVESLRSPVKKKVMIRDARIHDIPQLEDMLVRFYISQIELGNRLISKDPAIMKGGMTIEIGMMFNDPAIKIIIAERNNQLVGFIIGVLEFCDPVSRFMKCVRIKADYMEENSLARGLILRKMWETLESWGIENGAGFFYALIHPGNQPSIRGAKEVGFKHHTTQFIKIPKLEK